jgi:pimeloyl-ACP methyl ester carboxylesterase
MVKNIVLLHGWGAETKKLKPLKHQLEKRGWNVYLPKIVGFEKPPPAFAWGIKEYSAYIKDEARKKFTDEKYFIFGHSFGGGIAIKLASLKIDNIQGVVLCATRGISRGKSIKRLVFAGAAKAGKLFLITPVLAGKFKKILYKAAREHDYEKLDGVMKEVFKKVISEDLKPLITKINKPVLIIWGREDKVTPVSDAYYINKNLKECKLTIFNAQGHQIPYNIPEKLAEEIDLWQTLLRS